MYVFMYICMYACMYLLMKDTVVQMKTSKDHNDKQTLESILKLAA